MPLPDFQSYPHQCSVYEETLFRFYGVVAKRGGCSFFSKPRGFFRLGISFITNDDHAILYIGADVQSETEMMLGCIYAPSIGSEFMKTLA